MSKKKHTIKDNDAEMDHSQFETPDTHEVTSNQPQVIKKHMDSAEFESKLTDFFTTHKPTKLRLVSKIAFEFIGQEEAVLEHLHNKYVLKKATPKATKKTISAASTSAEHADDSNHPLHLESDEVAKPKSKKKLIIIIVVVAVAVLGVACFLMKDKLMGKGKAPETEQGVEKAAVGEGKSEEAKPKEEVVALKTETTDSSAVATDSAKVN
jgi:hypothetical protein